MIERLGIKNFKSIKELDFACKKLNVIIGEPNSGKSNILEALALLSQNAIGMELNHEMFRYKTIGDLFFDFNINKAIEVNTGDKLTTLQYAVRENGISENQFHFYFNKLNQKEEEAPAYINFAHDGKKVENGSFINDQTNVRFYEFKRLSQFSNSYMPHLSVPYGDNLPGLLLSNPEYKKWVSDFFRDKGLRLTIKPTEFDIMLSKLVDDEIYSYPYFTISETLQRVVFYCMSIKSNKDSVLIFDEPESNTFPFYTKYLAERIALDETNQFFITTHNPYLLLSLIEKSKIQDLNVCIAEMKDYQTTIKVLDEDEITRVLDLNSDVFFNFNQFTEV